MPDKDEIWYAAQATEVLITPQKTLETFGSTVIDYWIISELMDNPNSIRIREGRIHAERPKVILPQHYAHQLLENFGEEAREFADQFAKSAEGLRILQYGLRFRKEDYNEQVQEGNLEEVTDRVSSEIRGKNNPLAALLSAVDDLWEVSLFKFTAEFIQASAPGNFRDLNKKGLLASSSNSIPNAVRIEIENDFRSAEGNRARLQKLARKLKTYGVFADYEDRFYKLYSRAF